MVSWYTPESSLAPTALQAIRSADEPPTQRRDSLPAIKMLPRSRAGPSDLFRVAVLNSMLRQQRNILGELVALEKSL